MGIFDCPFSLPLSHQQFKQALLRGHGRAIRHVQLFGDAGLEDVLMDACVRSDSARPGARFLARILECLPGHTTEHPYRKAIIDRLAKPFDSDDAASTCFELALDLADQGDAEAAIACEAFLPRILTMNPQMGAAWALAETWGEAGLALLGEALADSLRIGARAADPQFFEEFCDVASHYPAWVEFATDGVDAEIKARVELETRLKAAENQELAIAQPCDLPEAGLDSRWRKFDLDEMEWFRNNVLRLCASYDPESDAEEVVQFARRIAKLLVPSADPRFVPAYFWAYANGNTTFAPRALNAINCLPCWIVQEMEWIDPEAPWLPWILHPFAPPEELLRG